MKKILQKFISAVFMNFLQNHKNKLPQKKFLAGPVRLFVPYKRRKREPSVSGSPVLKKSMSFSSDSLPKSREGEVTFGRSSSSDSVNHML